MMTEGKHEGTPREEGGEALWRLLERAPRPKPVSPYFARRVLREVAALVESQPAGGGLSHWLARTWPAWRGQPRWAFAGALAALALLAAAGVGFSSLRWGSPSALVKVSSVEPAASAVPAVEGEMVPPDAVAGVDPGPQPSVAVPSEPVVTAQDVEVIADLDNLLSHEESRLWIEDDTARF